MIKEPRPFHIEEFRPSKCSFEYGNPSGHSLVTVSSYLTLWHYNYRKHNLRVPALIANVIFISLVIFSRLYAGVHTLNQLLNGTIWGVTLYWLFTRVFYYRIAEFVADVKHMPIYKLFFNPIIGMFYLMYACMIMVYLMGPGEEEHIWLEKTKVNCPNLKTNNKGYDTPYFKNFETFSFSSSWLGCYIGLIIE